jgi:hypothetical protein
VIAVSSRGHRAGGINFDDINFEHTEYAPMRAYAQSKSANALFAVHLDRLAKQYGVRAFAVHPGPIPTSDLFAESAVGIKSNFTVGLLRGLAKIARGLHITQLLNAVRKPDTPNAFKTIQQGAATLVWAATSRELDDIGGVYCEDCNIAEFVPADSDEPFGVRPWAIDDEQAARLWNVCEEMTGVEICGSLPATFGQSLIKLMEWRGLTDEGLAEAALVSAKTIQRMRTVVDRKWKLEAVMAVCIGLHLPPYVSFDLIAKAGLGFQANERHITYKHLLSTYYESTIIECNEFLETAGYEPIGREE